MFQQKCDNEAIWVPHHKNEQWPERPKPRTADEGIRLEVGHGIAHSLHTTAVLFRAEAMDMPGHYGLLRGVGFHTCEVSVSLQQAHTPITLQSSCSPRRADLRKGNVGLLKERAQTPPAAPTKFIESQKWQKESANASPPPAPAAFVHVCH